MGVVASPQQEDDPGSTTRRASPAGPPDVFRADLPPDSTRLPDVRHRLAAWLTARGVATGRAQDVVLAADEALANAIEHGYRDTAGAGRVRITVAVASDGVRMVVTDHGHWRPPVDDPDSTRGWGLRMLAALADDLAIDHGGDRTTVTARFGAPPPG